MQPPPTDKVQLVNQIRISRFHFDERLKDLPAEQFDQLLYPGGMTVKELLYHIAWHENQMSSMLRDRKLAGSDWWNLPTDQRNANIQAEAQTLSLPEVLAYASSAFQSLLHELRRLPPEALDDPSFFDGMPQDWSPADLLAQNTYQHYAEHNSSLSPSKFSPPS